MFSDWLPSLRISAVVSDHAVADVDDAVRVLRDIVFVRDHKDGIALAVQMVEERHDLIAGL